MKKQTKIANSIRNELKKTCPQLIKSNKEIFNPMKKIPKVCRKHSRKVKDLLKRTKEFQKKYPNNIKK